MELEFGLTIDCAKAATLEVLRANGFTATSGGVLLAFPFCVRVEDVPADEHENVCIIVASVDPNAVPIATLSVELKLAC